MRRCAALLGHRQDDYAIETLHPNDANGLFEQQDSTCRCLLRRHLQQLAHCSESPFASFGCKDGTFERLGMAGKDLAEANGLIWENSRKKECRPQVERSSISPTIRTQLTEEFGPQLNSRGIPVPRSTRTDAANPSDPGPSKAKKTV